MFEAGVNDSEILGLEDNHELFSIVVFRFCPFLPNKAIPLGHSLAVMMWIIITMSLTLPIFRLHQPVRA